jgi:hypothetical protein
MMTLAGLGQRELVQQVGHVRGGEVADHLADAGEALLEPEPDALQQFLGGGHGVTSSRRVPPNALELVQQLLEARVAAEGV